MAKTKMKRSVARRIKSGKKTSTRNKKRKNVIRGGLPIGLLTTIVTALFGLAKLSVIVPADTCKLDGTESIDLCKSSYSDSDPFNFIKELNPDEKTELFDAARRDNKETVAFKGVNWDVFEQIDWENVNDIKDLNTKYEFGIKQKDKELAASGNTLIDRAVKTRL